MIPVPAAPPSFAPVTLGSPRFRAVRSGGFRVTEAAFSARSVVPVHAHEHTVLSVILAGGFALAFERGTHDCVAGTAFVEPGGERHADTLGAEGAEVLVIEVGPEAHGALGSPCERLLAEPRTFLDGEVSRLAVGLRRRLRTVSSTSVLEVEALVLELFGVAAQRLPGVPEVRGGPWLERVREMLHANLTRPPCVADLAREVGVHRVHLGRAFRVRFGTSVGEYHRRLRVAWAEEQLARSEEPVGIIALRAGFADHSHFTRIFKRLRGTTPEVWRRSRTS